MTGTGVMACRLCGGPAEFRFARRLLGRIEAGYFQCGRCGLTQTEEPSWLEEAYASPIAAADTGVLARNLRAREIVATFLHLAGMRGAAGLDYAGGYGLFTRLMRDAGFPFHWADPYTANLFARGFEWRPGMAPPRVVTAFEVLEHWARPLEEFRRIAALGPEWIVTSTELHPGPAPDPAWSYLVPETGQHIAFYRPDTLRWMSREAGYPHARIGPAFQLFGRRPLPGLAWTVALRFGALLWPLVRGLRPSLTLEDSERLRAHAPDADSP